MVPCSRNQLSDGITPLLNTINRPTPLGQGLFHTLPKSYFDSRRTLLEKLPKYQDIDPVALDSRLPCNPLSVHVLPSNPLSVHVLPSNPLSLHVLPSNPLSLHVLPSNPLSVHVAHVLFCADSRVVVWWSAHHIATLHSLSVGRSISNPS